MAEGRKFVDFHGVLVPLGEMLAVQLGGETPEIIREIAEDILNDPKSFGLSGLEKAIETINHSVRNVRGMQRIKETSIEFEVGGQMERYCVRLNTSAYSDEQVIGASLSFQGTVVQDGDNINNEFMGKLK